MMRKRNKHHVAIQEKLHRLSMAVEVRLISSGLTEQEASKNKLSESLKARPKCLTRKKGWKLSEETKSRQSEAAKLRWVIRKLSDAT